MFTTDSLRDDDPVPVDELADDAPLDSLLAWMKLLSADMRRWRRDDVTVNIYGQGDAVCVVIEQYRSLTSPMSVDQYVFHETPGSNALLEFVAFVADAGVTLARVLERARALPFDDEDAATCVGGLGVYHRVYTETIGETAEGTSLADEAEADVVLVPVRVSDEFVEYVDARTLTEEQIQQAWRDDEAR